MEPVNRYVLKEKRLRRPKKEPKLPKQRYSASLSGIRLSGK